MGSKHEKTKANGYQIRLWRKIARLKLLQKTTGNTSPTQRVPISNTILFILYN
jgi:hypothetical protein